MRRAQLANPELFPPKAMKRLIWPLMVEQLLAILIGMADTVMVSSAGEAAVSGVSLVDSLNVVLINLFSALATGGAVVTAQYIGRRDEKSARSSAKQLLYASAALSLLLAGIAIAFHRLLLRGIYGSIDDDVMANAQTYFLLSAASYPFLAIYNSGAALFRSMGNSRISMLISLLMNLINIGGNALLIYGFSMGVAGAAIASLAARAAAAVLITVLIMKPRYPIHIDSLFRPELRWGMVRSILKVGIPNAIENSMFQIGKILTMGLVSAMGTAAIAANAIAGSVAGISGIPGGAICLGVVTVMGQCVGARDYEQAVYYTKRLVKIAYLCLLATNLLIFCFAGVLVPLFGLSKEATVSAEEILRVFALFSATIWIPSFVMPSALRAAGDAHGTMIISAFSMWVFRVGFSYLFVSLGMGVQGVWAGMYVDWLVRGIIYVTRFMRGKWKKMHVIE